MTQQERFAAYGTRITANGGLLDFEWDDYHRLERELYPERHAAKEAKMREKEAVGNALSRIPENLYWLIGKGRTQPTEPLYGVQLLDAATGAVIVEAEAETLSAAIVAATELLPPY